MSFQGALVLAGFPCTAGVTDEDGFEAMVEEAQSIAGCRLRRNPTVSKLDPSRPMLSSAVVWQGGE